MWGWPFNRFIFHRRAKCPWTHHLSGSSESPSFPLSRDIPSDAFFLSNCSWRFSYKPLTCSSFSSLAPFSISAVLSRSSFWGGEGCVLLRSAVESVTSPACVVEVFRSKGRLSRAISMLACFRSPSRVSKLDLTFLLRSCGREYDFWLRDEWSWLTCIAGIWGYAPLSIMSWVLRWLNVTSVLLVDKSWRFWSELLFFIPLTVDFDTVLGEVTWRMCVAVLVALGVTRPVESSRALAPNVALSYPDTLASRRAICSVETTTDMS